MWKFSQPKMYGSGGNSSFVIKELIMQHFYVFQKKSPELSITWNKMNNSSDLLISYSSITQTQIKHLLPTSFKFRVNSHVKIVISKTRENSRLKTRYLKGIITEQLFMISIMRIHLQVLFIYLALKNRNLKQTLYTLFILFLFFRSHITNIYI